MDLNDLRTLWTVLSFLAFLGIVWWAYGGKRKARFDEAARLALDDEPGGAQRPARTEIKGDQT
jgi:cytochrome c oxidase cbb3-type subunit IV